MKIIALCKTWRGEEFAIASLESIYRHVSRVIYCHSEKSWTGESGNTVAPVIEKWVADGNDAEDKVEQIFFDTDDQSAQYEVLEKAANKHKHDFKMLIDTDEVWDDKCLERAIDEHLVLKAAPQAFTCEMECYIRSPLYRVTPRQGLHPVVFVRAGTPLFGVRAVDLPVKVHMEDVFFHHFCSVRNDLESVLMKHHTSCGVEKEPAVPAGEWVPNVWNDLPAAKKLLPLANHRAAWKGVKVISPADLPATVQKMDIVLGHVKYVLAPRRAPEAAADKAQPKPDKKVLRHHEGRLCVFTVVDDAYAPFVPMFSLAANRALNGAGDVRVEIRGKTIKDELPAGPFVTAAARYLLCEEALAEYDYVLITDVDIMLMPENSTIIDQHMRHVLLDGTECYENWISQVRPDGPRMPGVHFVTRDWWARTRAARDVEINRIIMAGGVDDYCYDEVMLGRIARESGLPLPPVAPKLWRHHGVHLGDWRIHLSKRGWLPSITADESYLYRWMLDDAEFQEAARVAAEKISYLGPAMKRWRLLFK